MSRPEMSPPIIIRGSYIPLVLLSWPLAALILFIAIVVFGVGQ